MKRGRLSNSNVRERVKRTPISWIPVTKSELENVIAYDNYYIFIIGRGESTEYYLAPNKRLRTEADTYFIKSIIAHKNNESKHHHFHALELWFRDELEEINYSPDMEYLERILEHYPKTQNYIDFFNSMTLKGWELFDNEELIDFSKNNHCIYYQL